MDDANGLYNTEKIMTNNDVVRRLRFTLDMTDSDMMETMAHSEVVTSRNKISGWLKKEDDPNYLAISDLQLAQFLNGLIIARRGKREGPPMIAEKRLNNNLILLKLKIALAYKAEDVVGVMKLAGFDVSIHEVTAFFRRPEQSQYRLCKDQFLRNFLMGLQIKYKGPTSRHLKQTKE